MKNAQPAEWSFGLGMKSALREEDDTANLIICRDLLQKTVL
jgi:hypothetical protein